MISAIYESSIGLMLFCESKPTLQAFLQRAQVRVDSYAEQFTVRLYWHVWGSVYDMEQDYRIYYKPEYSSFSDYLRRKHGCTRKAIKLIAERLSQYPGTRVFLRIPHHSSDANIGHFLTEYGSSITTTARCLGMELLQVRDEDPT